MQLSLKTLVLPAMIVSLVQAMTVAGVEIERDITLEAVPTQVIDSITRHNQDISLLKAEAVLEESLIMYEIEGTREGHKVEIQVNPQGDIINIKDENCRGNEK